MPKKSSPATIRERKFIAHYAVHFNGAAAVRYAGFVTEHAPRYAYELLSKPRVQAAVNKAMDELGELHFQLHNESIGALKVMRDALEDPMRMYGADGRVLDVSAWPDDLKACIVGLETEQRWEGKGDAAEPIKVTKVKFERRTTVIQTLAKLSGHLIERTQFIDAQGNPTNPPASAPAPVIYITVGKIEPAQGETPPGRKRKSK